MGVFKDTSVLSKRTVADGSMLMKLGLSKVPVVSATCIITRRLKPHEEFVKLNSDGCSKGNSGLRGGGCILRDAEGSIIWAQAEFFSIQNSMIAEAKALLSGLRRCVLKIINKVELEAESLVLIHILEKKIDVP